MTTEQAINEIVSSGYGQVQCHEETMRMAVDALRAQQKRENPKLLTVDELRRMDGHPVWVIRSTYGFGGKHILRSEYGLVDAETGFVKTIRDFVSFEEIEDGTAGVWKNPKEAQQ